MNKKLLLIINPVAGKMKSKTSLFDIVKVFCDNDFDVTVKLTARRGHGTEIAENEHKNYDLIVCVGGDGTLNEVVRGLVRSGAETPVGYIPAGSTNDFASSIGLSSSIKQAALNIAKGSPVKLDIGTFKDVYFTYIASFGAFTSTSYSTPQATKNAIGHMAYILEGIKGLNTIKPIHVKMEADGKVYEGDYIFGGIANSTSVGGIVKLKKELVDMSDGLFEVILIKNPKNIAHLNDIVLALATSEYKNNSSIEYFNASEIKVTTEDKLSWTVDGEYADGSGSFKIKNLKQKLTIIK
ncbi:MAG: YegS/Rv2252/BmrU family lipid kinase [Ruminococcaceae bacterium]|nr:YegS/Rv2252/BmrU family lipid kinase [Oscillospiraceae bacterium]